VLLLCCACVANILYSNEGVVKLADFGTSKKIADVANLSVGLKSLVGTPYMMAPEVIRQTGHRCKSALQKSPNDQKSPSDPPDGHRCVRVFVCVFVGYQGRG
jgi:serine/threonine protein kinase